MTIAFIEREDLFARCGPLAAHLRAWQAATYDIEAMRFDAGDRVILDGDEDEVLTAERAADLNAETAALFDTLKDRFEARVPDLAYAGLIVAEDDSATMEDFVATIGRRFDHLATRAGWERFFVVTDARRSILAQDNDHPPAAAAQRALRDIGFARERPDGVVCDREGMRDLLPLLFRIARHNASAPSIVFCAEGAASIGTLCKYANIHFNVYDVAEKHRLERQIPEAGLTIAKDAICDERFSASGAMEGRRLDIA